MPVKIVEGLKWNNSTFGLGGLRCALAVFGSEGRDVTC